ncbi:MAG: hypothetical protein QHC78_11430 [Pigmentiphaga sp.]|nr:hypothetical protein [Pigmentiphaga sp.]MDX3906291.1 hypothetical protein [Pigmentiphaga sp.]
MNTHLYTKTTPVVPSQPFSFRPAEVLVAGAKVLLPFLIMAGILFLAR